MHFKNSILTLLTLSICFTQVHGQSRKELEEKRKKTQADIAYTKQILAKTSQKKSAALHNLNAINQIITKRKEVIHGLTTEIEKADLEIIDKKKRLQELSAHFDIEKIRLHKTIVKAYKTRKHASEVAFVVASASFRQAIKRLKYLKKLSEYRSYLIDRIVESKDSVQRAIAAVEDGKKVKTALLGDEVTEKTSLEKDKEDKNKLVKSLSGEEGKLKKAIRRNEIAIARLNSTISKMIAQEIAEAKRRAAAERAKNKPIAAKPADNKTKTTSTAANNLTPEARALSTKFASNLGALPWPVERGYISQSFGVHAHPDLSGITLMNNGVDITTNSGAIARAVFSGSVSAIINIPGQEKAVLINHGEYYTVYSRLSEVYVNKGDEVSSKQNLGKVWTDDDGQTILQFQVWKGQAKQNPAIWIAGK